MQPPKKKIKVGGLDENGPDSETDDISVNEGPNSSTTRVFSQVPEENQVTHANTEVSSNLDGSGNASTGETTAGRGGTSDGDEWEYSQLDEMATKDAVVSNAKSNDSTHLRTCTDPQKAEVVFKHQWRHPNCRPGSRI